MLKSFWQRAAPVITLLLLAPVVSEVLSGSTRITTLFVLIPEIGVWGGGAVIIRYLARRLHRSWLTIWLLGIALAIAEEWIIQQTSLAPLIGVNPNHVYGRALGVNWVYFLWALGFESLWVVVVPIQLSELIFSARRAEPWIGRRGLIVTAVAFVLAAFVAWYSWTQVFLPRFYPAAVYRPQVYSYLIAMVAIAALVYAAIRARPDPGPEALSTRQAPRPWQAGLAAFGCGLAWMLLVLLAYGALPTLPVVVVIVAALLLVTVAYFGVRTWSLSAGWGDAHRFWLVLGIILATSIGGFVVLAVGKALAIDRVGQVAFNIIAVLLLLPLGRKSIGAGQ